MTEDEAKTLLENLGKFMIQTNDMLKILKLDFENMRLSIFNLEKRIKKLEKDKQIIIT